ncbi:hypothetical protein MUP59_01115 [Candidatus Bathyarchaeota archaeon]|nr:hypothetical protein [Candidatus Bathyarchaeota archaeon]
MPNARNPDSQTILTTRSLPVDGVVTPVNKLALATPFIALAGLIVAVSTVVVVKRRRD